MKYIYDATGMDEFVYKYDEFLYSAIIKKYSINTFNSNIWNYDWEKKWVDFKLEKDAEYFKSKPVVLISDTYEKINGQKDKFKF